MSFLAGMAVASKYNSFCIVLITFILAVFHRSINFKRKLIYISKSIFFVLLGFVIGTWQIRSSYNILFKQIKKVLFQSGDNAAHAVGENSFLNLDNYISGLKSNYANEPILISMFLLILIFLIFSLVYTKAKYFKNKPVIIISSFVVLLSTMFIAKYPLLYYQFSNYILIVFFATYFISKLPKMAILVLCILIFPSTIKNIQNYSNYLNNEINNSIFLEKYIQENKSAKVTLWDYGPTEDFMKIWTRSWGGGVYEEYLRDKRPELMELMSDYITVRVNSNIDKNVFDVCWDKLYIRESRALVFLDMNKKINLQHKPIGNTGIWEIISNHCPL